MTEKECITQLRKTMADEQQPYLFSEEEYKNCLAIAVTWYSCPNPQIRQGRIEVTPNQAEYLLPADCFTWKEGLENYTVSANKVFVEMPHGSFSISYRYLACRKAEEVPEMEMPFLLEYVQALLMEKMLDRNLLEEQSESKIKQLSLGRGLDVTMEDSGLFKEQVRKSLEQKKNAFLNRYMRKKFGGWQ